MSRTRTAITQSIRVLDHIYSIYDVAHFSRLPDEPGDIPSTFTMDYTTWEDMGQPEQITVTVRPGDELNDNV